MARCTSSLGLGAGEQLVAGGEPSSRAWKIWAEGGLAAVPGGGEGVAAVVVAEVGAGDVAGAHQEEACRPPRAGSKLVGVAEASRRVSWTMSSARPASRPAR
jgi:hypothetical protein